MEKAQGAEKACGMKAPDRTGAACKAKSPCAAEIHHRADAACGMEKLRGAEKVCGIKETYRMGMPHGMEKARGAEAARGAEKVRELEIPCGMETSHKMEESRGIKAPRGMGEPVKWARAQILDAAKQCVCGGRDRQYGSPEDNFRLIAALWAPYLHARRKDHGGLLRLDPEDIAAMMVLFKIARIATGRYSADSWIDTAGYAACGGEIGSSAEELAKRY